jgi:hypothetical protein
MLDVAGLIKTLLETAGKWTLTAPNPTAPVVVLDEFDPKQPSFQILLENEPDSKEKVGDGIYLVQHRVKITVFYRPTNFAPATVTAAKTAFNAIKTEIDRIILADEGNLTGVLRVDYTGWNDRSSIDTGRGSKKGLFKSEETLVFYYYVVNGRTSLSKVSSISIGVSAGSKYDWIGIKDINWKETDQWITIDLPKSVTVYQYLKPFRIEGTITCTDIASMYTALFNTSIDGSSHKAVVAASMLKYKVSYFKINLLSSAKDAKVLTLTNFRVRTIDFASLGENVNTGLYLVHFYADLWAYS